MPYTKTIDDDGVLFEVEPEKAPSFLHASFLLLLAPVIVLWMVDIKLGVLAILALAAWAFFIQRNKNVTQYRQRKSFKASVEGIKVNNRFYSKENIHRLKIRNHIDKNYVMSSPVYGMPGSMKAGLGLREKLLNVSYRVDLEAEGVAIVIAGGITEATAYAIVSDLNKIFEW
jgi:hypothetical protein